MFSTKIGNIKFLGIIHDNGLSGVFKWTPSPGFLNSLCVTFVALFLPNLGPFHTIISLLNYSFHFIMSNIRFKVTHVFKISSLSTYCSFSATDRLRKTSRTPKSQPIAPLFTSSSSLFILLSCSAVSEKIFVSPVLFI